MASDTESNKNLLEALNNRDLSAFAILHKTFRNKLLVMAFYITENEEEAKDLVQEFFIHFWENRLHEKITTSLNSYLIQAIKNRAINFRRSKDNQVKLFLKNFEATIPKTIHPMENGELHAELNKAIDELPPMASKVFRLFYIERLSYAEISKKLSISSSTVGGHLKRALTTLRSNLKKNF